MFVYNGNDNGNDNVCSVAESVLAPNITTFPTNQPSVEPTMQPSQSPTAYTIYDLQIEFTVEVDSKDESDGVYERLKSYYFFDEFKQCLLDSLNSEWVTSNYSNASIAEFAAQIGSMQESPFSDIDILSPTHSPTSYPTYHYEEGSDFGFTMIGLGVCMIVAVIAYWGYRRYSIHLDYKLEQKSAPPNSVELQTLFDSD